MIYDYKLLAGAGVSGLSVGLGIGLAAGLFFTKKKFETKYSNIAQEEIAEAKKFYSLLYKKGEYETPKSTVENRIPNNEEGNLVEAVDALQRYQGKTTILKEAIESGDPNRYRRADGKPIVPGDDTIPHNKSENDDAELDENGNFVEPPVEEEIDFDYEEELKLRSSDYPYVLSKDEFFTNENEWGQSSFTYFTGDDVLVDECDKPIRDSDGVVGDDNLLRFGHGSDDPNIVYIRNEKLELEFEVLCSRGKYTQEILGVIQHSDHRKTPKFRRDDG